MTKIKPACENLIKEIEEEMELEEVLHLAPVLELQAGSETVDLEGLLHATSREGRN